VFGERRLLAAKLAGLEEIPATVRELTDEQALHLQLIENLKREDLHELAEAEGYEQLAKYGHSVDEMAEQVGKSKATIYARMKLLALCPEGRKAFYQGKLTASTALLIARIAGEGSQKKAIKEITTPQWGNGPLSYREAAEHVQRNYMLKLSEAPFDTKLEDLVRGAVACGRCPKNTLAQPELFGDVKSGSAGVCTDAGCFQAKRKAFGARQLATAQTEGREIIAGQDAKRVAPHGATRSLQGYARLDEKCYEDPKSRTVRQIVGRDAETALLQDPQTGDVVEVVKESTLRAQLKESGVTRSAGSRGDAVREKKAKAERTFRRALFDQIFPKLSTELDLELLRAIAVGYAGRLWHELRKQICAIYGLEPKKKQYGTDFDAPLEAAIAKMSREEIARFLQVCEIAPDLQVSTWSDEKPKRLLEAAQRLKIDPAKVRKEAISAPAPAKPARKGKKKP
jgi:ParB-like chromosome segregation protein Spo0J